MKSAPETSLSHVGIAVRDQLYLREHARILRLCSLLLMNHHEAEEVVQDIFFRLVQTRAMNNAVLSWEAWLTTVAVNACRDRRRPAWWQWWSRRYREEQTLALATEENTPEKRPLSREGQAQVWRHFCTLSSRQREVYVLRRLEGLSPDDTAKILGLTSGSVKRYLFCAMRHLWKALGSV